MACAKRKPKQRLTLQTKLEILKAYDETRGNIKITELAKSMKLSRRTLVTIINNRTSLEEAPDEDKDRFRVRNKKANPHVGKSKYNKLEEELAKWINNKKKKKKLTGAIIRNTALKLAKEMGIENFTASNGWSDRFKKKFGISYQGKRCQCAQKRGNSNCLDISTEYINNLIKNSSNRCETSDNIYIDVEQELAKWLHAQDSSSNMTMGLIKDMALTIAGILGATKFKASSGWLDKFRKKHNSQIYQCQCCTDEERFSDLELQQDKEQQENSQQCTDIVSRRSDNTMTVRSEHQIHSDFDKLKEKNTETATGDEQSNRQKLQQLKEELEVVHMTKEVYEIKRRNISLAIANLELEMKLGKHTQN